jgi:hypothetical protein
VFAEVEEDVRDRAPDLARRPQVSRVIAMRPYWAASVADAIDGLGATGGDAVQTSSERSRGVSLDDQMEVVDLDRKMKHAERRARCPPERNREGGEQTSSAERRDIGGGPQRDVNGTTRIVKGPGAVKGARPSRRPLAASAWSRTTPTRRNGQLELSRSWRATRHLESAMIIVGRGRARLRRHFASLTPHLRCSPRGTYTARLAALTRGIHIRANSASGAGAFALAAEGHPRPLSEKRARRGDEGSSLQRLADAPRRRALSLQSGPSRALGPEPRKRAGPGRGICAGVGPRVSDARRAASEPRVSDARRAA